VGVYGYDRTGSLWVAIDEPLVAAFGYLGYPSF
jgi:hypothetical protein